MDFLELAKARYSVRKYMDKQIEQEKLDKILEAGNAAPTAINYQPQKMLLRSKNGTLERKTSTKHSSTDKERIQS